MVWLWALILIVVGALILLHNYFLLDFDIRQWWPILLVILGLQVLLRGDLGFSQATQSFGITRGSVEAGSLHASSGELDITLSALAQPGRLVAGEYTARSRPQLQTDGKHAVLSMERGRTWLLSMADWDIRLARDLPWNLSISSFLGEVRADLRGLALEQASIATGITDIFVILPEGVTCEVTLRSSLGNIEITLPEKTEAALEVQVSRFFDIQLENPRWQAAGPNQYATPEHDTAADVCRVIVRGTFGGLTLR
ncbi:MAG: hypothetical protein JXN59_12640 [Anaerolineae bacterium]|nr:hypothetical protein [Anaerolineae bacterium]